MARQKKSPQKKASVATKRSVRSSFKSLGRTVQSFLKRRPHRSFRRTRRRDYVRSLELPGYIPFTIHVVKIVARFWRPLLLLLLLTTLATIVLSGIGSQETYRQLSEGLDSAGEGIAEGALGEVTKAGLLLITSLDGTLSVNFTDSQYIYSTLIVLFIWLITVWFLRAALSGNEPKLRMAIYNAGAPLLPTIMVSTLLVLQLVPAALALIAYSAALATDFLSNPLISIVFFFVMTLLIVLSIYLLVSTFFALVVVTLPGMYRWRAVRTAGDMVTGRRLRLLLRLSWLLLLIALWWILTMIPTILFVNWLQESVSFIATLPIVPLFVIIMTIATVQFVSTYIYILYRKVLDDDAAPA